LEAKLTVQKIDIVFLYTNLRKKLNKSLNMTCKHY